MIESSCVILGRQSGKDFNRFQSKKLAKKMKPDDLLYIKGIDRLGRSFKVILERDSHVERCIDIVALDMLLLDTWQGWKFTRMPIAVIGPIRGRMAATIRIRLRSPPTEAKGIVLAYKVWLA